MKCIDCGKLLKEKALVSSNDGERCVECFLKRGNMLKEIIFPKHYDPLPEGYKVYQDEGDFYIWINDALKSSKYWDKYAARRAAFRHSRQCLQRKELKYE